MAIRTQWPAIISRETSGSNATSKIRAHSATSHKTNKEPSMARPRFRSEVRPEPGAAGDCVSVVGRECELAGMDWPSSCCAFDFTRPSTAANTNTTPHVREARDDTPSATPIHGGGSPLDIRVRTKKHMKAVTQTAKVMPALLDKRLYRSVSEEVMFLPGECPHLRLRGSCRRVRNIHGPRGKQS